MQFSCIDSINRVENDKAKLKCDELKLIMTVNRNQVVRKIYFLDYALKDVIELTGMAGAVLKYSKIRGNPEVYYMPPAGRGAYLKNIISRSSYIEGRSKIIICLNLKIIVINHD